MNGRYPQLNIGRLSLSPDLFLKGYASGEGPCTCTAVCCAGGVYADIKEMDKILEHKDIIKKYLDETQPEDEREWFEQHEFVDSDFPSGCCIGTREHNNKCAFLDKLGRCSLQVAAVAEGMHKWSLKPLFCILYPIEVSEGVVGFDDMLQEEQACCTVSGEFDVPMFEACREELTHLVGRDGFDLMQKHYDELRNIAKPVEVREEQ